MSKVLKWNEPSFVQEALSMSRTLLCAPRKKTHQKQSSPFKASLKQRVLWLVKMQKVPPERDENLWKMWRMEVVATLAGVGVAKDRVWERNCGKESMPGSVYGFSNARTMWREGKFGGLFRIKFRGTLYVPMKALEHYFIGNRRHKEY